MIKNITNNTEFSSDDSDKMKKKLWGPFLKNISLCKQKAKKQRWFVTQTRKMNTKIYTEVFNYLSNTLKYNNISSWKRSINLHSSIGFAQLSDIYDKELCNNGLQLSTFLQSRDFSTIRQLFQLFPWIFKFSETSFSEKKFFSHTLLKIFTYNYATLLISVDNKKSFVITQWISDLQIFWWKEILNYCNYKNSKSLTTNNLKISVLKNL